MPSQESQMAEEFKIDRQDGFLSITWKWSAEHFWFLTVMSVGYFGSSMVGMIFVAKEGFPLLGVVVVGFNLILGGVGVKQALPYFFNHTEFRVIKKALVVETSPFGRRVEIDCVGLGKLEVIDRGRIGYLARTFGVGSKKENLGIWFRNEQRAEILTRALKAAMRGQTSYKT